MFGLVSKKKYLAMKAERDAYRDECLKAISILQEARKNIHKADEKLYEIIKALDLINQ